MTGWIVVGAGFTGATIARCLADAGHEVTVMDRRATVGGNAADAPDIHLYGPHIFHTNSERVVDFLSRFTEWRDYEHRVQAQTPKGRVPMPVNLDTIEVTFPKATADLVKEKLIAEYGEGSQVPIERLRASQDIIVGRAGEEIFELFFDGYTRKMWGVSPEKLSPGVTGRVPVRLNRDDRYFTDRFQRQPAAGYTALFDAMLDHPRIDVYLELEFRLTESDADNVVYTGPVDELFDHRWGELPYRSLRFETITEGAPRALSYAATVNYVDAAVPYTRETEMGVVTGSGINRVVRETPIAHVPGVTEPYYPIPLAGGVGAKEYVDKARGLGIVTAGRLADYKYYNMDQAVARGLTVARQIIGGDA